MNIRLRPATIQDSALIADISRQTFIDTFAADNKPEDMELFLTQQFTRGRLMLEVGRPGLEFILAYTGDLVAGYVKLREGKEPAGLAGSSALEIARLYVCEPFIGKGIGAKLMAESIRKAEEKEKEWIWLGVWQQNARAIAFYERWGFEKFGTCDFTLGTDVQQDWLMKKKLR